MLSQVKPTCTPGYNGKITKKVGLWEIEKTKVVWHQGFTSVPHTLFSLSLSLLSPQLAWKKHSGLKAERGEPPFFSVSVSVSLSIGRPRKPFSIQVPISFSISAFFCVCGLSSVFVWWVWAIFVLCAPFVLVLDKRVCFCFYFFLVIEYMGLLGCSLMWWKIDLCDCYNGTILVFKCKVLIFVVVVFVCVNGRKLDRQMKGFAFI